MGANEDLSAASLDQVRKILLGDQVKRGERNLARVEERIAREIKSLRTELFKRLDAFELQTKKAHEGLTSKLKAESQDRTANDKELDQEIAELARTLGAKISQLSDSSAKSLKGLRDQLQSESKGLRAEFDQKVDELSEEVDGELEEVRTEKVGKMDLSDLLADVALRLGERKQIRRTE